MSSEPISHRRGTLVAILVIATAAVLLRVCNLGSFSLWLDEVFTMTVAALPLRETLAACAADAENVPLYAVVANIGLRIGLDDPWIRLLPIAAGLGSILLLSMWTARHFGRAAALLAAAFCALSPFHLRYSQELRAYPYLLLLATLTLVVADRLRRRPDLGSTLALAATVALGCYAHLSYLLVLVPATGLMLLPMKEGEGAQEPRMARGVRGRFAAGVSIGVLAFVPWLWLISGNLTQRMAGRPTTDWSWELAGQRWQSLTIAAHELEGLSWFGVLLGGCAAVGLAAALATRVGRAVLLPAVAAMLAWELLLVGIEHWSIGRYDTVLWPFIAILIALGFQRLLQMLRPRWLQWAAGAGVAVMLLVHVDAYHRLGRPHWDRLALAVQEVRLPDEALVTGDWWARSCLSHYLGEPVETLGGRPERLTERLRHTPSLLLVTRRRPTAEEVWAIAEQPILLAELPRTGALYRLQGIRAEVVDADAAPTADAPVSWPAPYRDSVREGLLAPPIGCVGRLLGGVPGWRGGGKLRLDFDRRSRPSLHSGWARLEAWDDSSSVAWVLGREAVVAVHRSGPAAATIRLRLWPHPEIDGQRIRILINGHELGIRSLEIGANIVELDAPAELWRDGRNLLVLQFSESCCPAAAGPPRAAVVDWIEVRR